MTINHRRRAIHGLLDLLKTGQVDEAAVEQVVDDIIAAARDSETPHSRTLAQEQAHKDPRV